MQKIALEHLVGKVLSLPEYAWNYLDYHKQEGEIYDQCLLADLQQMHKEVFELSQYRPQFPWLMAK